MTRRLSQMPKNKRVPDALLSRLHGKGTMSEILDIEPARLREQSAQDMQRRLSSVDAADSGTLAELTPGADTEQLTGGMAEQIFEVNRSSKSPPVCYRPATRWSSGLLGGPKPLAISERS